MADRITEVISDGPLRSEMGQEARRWAQEFDWERTSNQFLELVNQTISLIPMRAWEKKGSE